MDKYKFDGVQVVYTWKSLEPEKDHYDFTQIESDLQLTNNMHKKLFIQIQDRFFEDPQYNPTFSCDKYFNAELENIGITKKYFKHSYVVQYVNFFPCEWNNDHKYMSRLFQFAINNNIGLGGPDIVPYKKSQMKNSYQFFHKYKGRLTLVSMAVQEPTMTYINPKTKKRFTQKEFIDFGVNYLGVNIIFWNLSMISSFKGKQY